MANNRDNKVCIICGEKYSYCPNCGSDSSKPTWYNIFDGENCKEIYDVCTSYRDKLIDKKCAAERLEKCDLSLLKNFKDSTRGQIKEILNIEKPVQSVVKKEVEFKEEKPIVKDKNVKKNK